MNTDDRVRHVHFMANFTEAISKVVSLVWEREKEYNAHSPIQQIVSSPERALMLAEIKVNRIGDQLKSWAVNKEDAAKKEGLQDSILDAMAYLGFVYAWTEEPGGEIKTGVSHEG